MNENDSSAHRLSCGRCGDGQLLRCTMVWLHTHFSPQWSGYPHTSLHNGLATHTLLSTMVWLPTHTSLHNVLAIHTLLSTMVWLPIHFSPQWSGYPHTSLHNGLATHTHFSPQWSGYPYTSLHNGLATHTLLSTMVWLPTHFSSQWERLTLETIIAFLASLDRMLTDLRVAHLNVLGDR